MEKLLSVIVCILIIGFASCSSEDKSIIEPPTDNSKIEVQVKLNLVFEPFEGERTKQIADEIKFITLLLFDATTQQYDRRISFDVVGSEYMFKIPTGNWTVVLLGTGDGLIADFATPLAPGTSLLTDEMVEISNNAGVYSNIREYFYAKQTITVTDQTIAIPRMAMRRIVSKLTVQTSPQLSDSLDYVSIELKNAVKSVNFLGVKSSTYINQFQEKDVLTNGIYGFEFYSLGTKPLGPGVNDFHINMGYTRKSNGLLKFFKIYDPADFQSGGLIVNTRTNLVIGI